MRGIQGLVVAIGLGICGAFFNWIYLSTKSQEVAMEYFVGIKPKMSVDRNETLTMNHIVPVPIPREAAATLKDFAIPYSAHQSVVGHSVTRPIPGGSLLLNDDLRTPPTELNFGQTDKDGQTRERAMWVPFDTRAFVPSLITPGDMVSFLVTRPYSRPTMAARPGPSPTPVKDAKPPAGGAAAAGPAPAGTPQAAPGLSAEAESPLVPVVAPGGSETGQTELLGPFRVLSVGNRLGSVDAFRAAKMPQVQENVLTISVSIDLAGQLEPKAQRLWDLIRASNFQQVGVMLHPRKK